MFGGLVVGASRTASRHDQGVPEREPRIPDDLDLDDRANLHVVLFQINNLAGTVAALTAAIAAYRNELTDEQYEELVAKAAARAEDLRLWLSELTLRV